MNQAISGSTHNVANSEGRSLQDNGSIPVLTVETQRLDVFVALEGLGEIGLTTNEEEHCGRLMAQVAIEIGSRLGRKGAGVRAG